MVIKKEAVVKHSHSSEGSRRELLYGVQKQEQVV